MLALARELGAKLSSQADNVTKTEFDLGVA
jgi:hypothetical protein